jgi:hypothetical protein
MTFATPRTAAILTTGAASGSPRGNKRFSEYTLGCGILRDVAAYERHVLMWNRWQDGGKSADRVNPRETTGRERRFGIDISARLGARAMMVLTDDAAAESLNAFDIDAPAFWRLIHHAISTYSWEIVRKFLDCSSIRSNKLAGDE